MIVYPLKWVLGTQKHSIVPQGSASAHIALEEFYIAF